MKYKNIIIDADIGEWKLHFAFDIISEPGWTSSSGFQAPSGEVMVITAQILGGDIHPSKLFLVFSLPIKGSYSPSKISSTFKISLFVYLFIFPIILLHITYFIFNYIFCDSITLSSTHKNKERRKWPFILHIVLDINNHAFKTRKFS